MSKLNKKVRYGSNIDYCCVCSRPCITKKYYDGWHSLCSKYCLDSWIIDQDMDFDTDVDNVEEVNNNGKL